MTSSKPPITVLQVPTLENEVPTGKITTIIITSQAQATEVNALLVQWSMQQANKGVKK